MNAYVSLVFSTRSLCDQRFELAFEYDDDDENSWPTDYFSARALVSETLMRFFEFHHSKFVSLSVAFFRCNDTSISFPL